MAQLHTWILTLFLFVPFFLIGQDDNPLFEPEQKVTRALVVGISDYQSPEQKLNFAHRDAILFSEFLKSPEGGNVHPDSIKLLINEHATKDAIYTYLYRWLLKESKPGEKAIFFFSGHGDVETETFFEEGFLLAYDTPPNNYVGNAISVDRLNKVISSLSLKGIDVTVVTDACRSGKLAGSDINGAMRTAQAMGTKTGDAVKMLSCQADQKSTENTRFGNGMGAFTFYLLKGLYGEAAVDGKKVTALDIEDYLKRTVPREVQETKQLPKLDYTDPFQELVFLSSGVVPFTGHIDNEVLLEATGGLLKGAATDASSNALLNQLKQAIEAGNLLGENSAETIHLQLQRTSMAEQATRDYLIALQEPSQLAINAYLIADSTEMAKRFFKTYAGEYGKIADYLKKASTLMGQDNPLIDEVHARVHYFSGLALRFGLTKGQEGDWERIYKDALRSQHKAVAKLPEAAYIHNEIAILNMALGKKEKAVEYFGYANERAPTWGLPYSNLCGVLAELGKHEEAEKYCELALKYGKASSASAFTNIGLSLFMQGKLIDAEEANWRSVLLDQSDWHPFQNLGAIYLRMGELDRANLMFYEADLRKVTAIFSPPTIDIRVAPAVSDMDGEFDVEEDPEIWPDLQRMIEINPNDIQAYMELGSRAFLEADYEEANSHWHKVTEIDSLFIPVYYSFMSLADSLGNRPGKLLLFEKLLQLEAPSSGLHFNAVAFYTSLDRKDLLEAYALDRKDIGLHLGLLKGQDRWEELEALALASATADQYSLYYSTWSDQYPDRGDIKYKIAQEYWGTSAIVEAINAPDQFGGLAELNWHLADNYAETAEDLKETSASPPSTWGFGEPIYWREQAKWKAGFTNIRESIKHRPDDIDLQLQELDFLYELRLLRSILPQLQNLHENGLTDVQAQGDLASLNAFDNQLSDAKSLLDELFGYYPHESFIDPNILVQAGVVSLLQEDISVAQNYFERAIKLDPADGKTAYQIARCFAQSGNTEMAMNWLQTAILYGFDLERILKYDPMLASLRALPAFEELLERYEIDLNQISDFSRFELKEYESLEVFD